MTDHHFLISDLTFDTSTYATLKRFQSECGGESDRSTGRIEALGTTQLLELCLIHYLLYFYLTFQRLSNFLYEGAPVPTSPLLVGLCT